MNRKLWTQIIFFGALWGLLEATVGHVLHFIPATIAGSIMFPIASAILIAAYLKTDSKKALFYIALLASAIKAVDFLLPALSVYKTINPMVSIVLEGVIVVAVIAVVSAKKPIQYLVALPVASIAWRTLFIGHMALQYVLTGNLAPYITDLSFALDFVLVQGLISGLFAIALSYGVILSLQQKLSFNIKPVVAYSLLIVASVATYFL